MKPSLDTKDLINELAAINNKATAGEKEDLVKKVAELMGTTLDNPENLKIAQAIVRTLANDAERTVRETLSSYMRSNSQLPKDVALQLASDIDSIALPILESSSLITEQELIAIIENSDSAAKQVAIAKRDDVTENISASLVTHAKDDTVITTLLENQTAQISMDSMNTIIEKKSGSEDVMNALAQRELVPIDMLQKITTSVSERIREAMLAKIQNKYGMSTHQLSSIADHSAAISVLKILDTRPTLFDARSLVTTLIETRRMQPDIFMTALLLGKRHFVKYSISMLADYPFSNLEKLLEAPEIPPKFEELLDSASLLPTFAVDIFHAIKFMEADPSVTKTSHEATHALYDYIVQHPELFPNAQYFKMMLQSQPAYQSEN